MKAWPVYLALILTSCERYSLSLGQIPVNVSYLASTHVHTPDPRQAHPPVGQKVILKWSVPLSFLQREPRIIFYIVYRDYTETTLVYHLTKSNGYYVYSLLNEEFYCKKGILTYRAIIETPDHTVYSECKHQLFVHLIDLKEEHNVEAERMSSSVSSHPMQGSVTETPLLNKA